MNNKLGRVIREKVKHPNASVVFTGSLFKKLFKIYYRLKSENF